MKLNFTIYIFLLSCTAVFTLLPGNARAASCTVTTTSVNFGLYDPFQATVNNVNGSITVSCTGTGRFTIALSTGQSGSYTTRYMLSGGTTDQLDYNLYTNNARTIIWGDGTGGTRVVRRRFRNNTRRVTVHGRIPAMQNISPGSYSDNIVATVNF